MIRKYLSNQIEGSENFTWGEALWLNQWEIYAFPIDSFVWQNIVDVGIKLQMIRKIFGKPIMITSWYRPKKYNELIGGATMSQHILGRAVDFNVQGMTADQVRSILSLKLSDLNIRMENLPGSNWVHIDINCNADTKLKDRFFKP